MSTQLQSIQKTFRVFYTLVRIAKTLCIVGAALCAVGALCITVASHGGQVFGLFGEPINVFAGTPDPTRMNAELWAAFIQLVAKTILLALAERYFKMEQADGTPFTEQGADRLKRLGIHCIWISIVAAVLAAIVATLQGAADAGAIDNSTEVITGIVLILASMIFRYGAQLEQKLQIAEQ